MCGHIRSEVLVSSLTVNLTSRQLNESILVVYSVSLAGFDARCHIIKVRARSICTSWKR